VQARLKAKIWVQAQIRQCQVQGIMAMVLHKGETDAGSVLVKINRFQAGCAVLSAVTTLEGTRAWMHGLSAGYGTERDCDAYIQRQVARDADLWVLEIEDYKSQYDLDAEILEG